MEINKTAIEIENATIRFRVNKSWVEQNIINISTIVLSRYNNEWNDLSTELLEENTTYYLFEAETPGFSVFAVKGEVKLAEIVDNESVCVVDELRCSDNLLEECDDSNWVMIEDCVNGCENGECREQTVDYLWIWILVLGPAIFVILLLVRKFTGKFKTDIKES